MSIRGLSHEQRYPGGTRTALRALGDGGRSVIGRSENKVEVRG
jgi:hypothetical protein